jgi:hypothetical protein
MVYGHGTDGGGRRKSAATACRTLGAGRKLAGW